METSFVLEGIVQDKFVYGHLWNENVENRYESLQCRACSIILNIPFTDQKRTILLFGGDGTYCFVKKTSRDYETEKPSPSLEKLLRQLQTTKL